MLLPGYPLHAVSNITLLQALHNAYEDGYRYVYLSIPRPDGKYHKFLNQIKTCGGLIAKSESYDTLNHKNWCYSPSNGIIRSKADSNAALMLFKPDGAKNHSISKFIQNENFMEVE